jgi:hypothetical protein
VVVDPLVQLRSYRLVRELSLSTAEMWMCVPSTVTGGWGAGCVVFAIWHCGWLVGIYASQSVALAASYLRPSLVVNLIFVAAAAIPHQATHRVAH